MSEPDTVNALHMDIGTLPHTRHSKESPSARRISRAVLRRLRWCAVPSPFPMSRVNILRLS